jgi:hypothetical protein
MCCFMRTSNRCSGAPDLEGGQSTHIHRDDLELMFFAQVDGVFTADPRKITTSRVLKEISRDVHTQSFVPRRLF